MSLDKEDRQARQQALDPLLSCLVIAPAGAGKTELLAQRVMKLLTRVENPEEILAITFTRKAAAEMHRRIIDNLREADSTEEVTGYRAQTLALAREALARDRACGWKLLENPSRLSIRTVDGFCSWLTGKLPWSSKLGGTMEIASAPAECYNLAVQHLLAELETAETTEVTESLMQLLQWMNNDWLKLQNLFSEMLLKRDQWLPFLYPFHYGEEDSISTLRVWLEESRERLCSGLIEEAMAVLDEAGIRSEVFELAQYAASNLAEGNIAELKKHSDYPTETDPLFWKGIGELLTTKEGWRKKVDKRQGFPAGDAGKAMKEQMKSLLGACARIDCSALLEVKNMPSIQFEELQWQQLKALSQLLVRSAGHLKTVFAELGKVDYIEVAMAAREGLGQELDPGTLALRLGFGIRHILVDECQDFSRSQYQLLERLTQGWVEHNEENPDSPCTLFLVGDGMQSCYRFREAEVGLFLQAARDGIGGLPLKTLKLHNNYRSHGGIVDWVNRHFVEILPEQDLPDQGAVSYTEALASREKLPEAAVSGELFYSEQDDAGEQLERAEANRVAELAREAVADCAERNGEVAILVRNRKHLRSIIPVLRKSGLRWQAEEIDSLAYRQVAQDLLSLTRALLDPWDRTAWLALLRAPWCGLDDDALFQLCSGGERRSLLECIVDKKLLEQLSEDQARVVERLATAVHAAYEARGRQSLRRWVQGVWLQLGGPATLTELDQSEDVEAVLGLLDELDGGQALEAIGLMQQAEKLFAAPDLSAPGLKLMTIHKAKGLEFDTVIIPGLNAAGRPDSQSLLWEQPLTAGQRGDLLLACNLPSSREDDAMHQLLALREKQRNLYEEKRLLYIACTRAIRKLYLLAAAEYDSGGALKTRGWALKDGVWDLLKSSFTLHNLSQREDSIELSAAEAGSSDSVIDYWRLNSDWQLPSAPGSYVVSGEAARPVREDSEDKDQRGDFSILTGFDERRMGVVLHQALARIAEEGLESWDAGRLAKEHPIWLASLRQQGIDAELLERYASEIADGVTKTLNDPDGRWILADWEDGGAEIPLMYFPEGEIRRLIVDRSFVDEAGIRWIIDYKSSLPKQGEKMDDFLSRQSELYYPQLDAYRQAYRLIEKDRQVRIALYFSRLPQLHKLPD